MGLIFLSGLFLGAEGGCHQALEDIAQEEAAAVDAPVAEPEAKSYQIMDENLKQKIREGKVTLERTEGGDFLLTKENGEVVVLEGQKVPPEIIEESQLGSGPAIENAPVP